MRRRIDLDKLNPDWQFAYNHGKASKPGLISERRAGGSMMLCPCCLHVVQKEPISLWQNSKQLFFLGYGFPLFYNMLQFCLMLVFMLIVSNSAVMLFNAVNQDCTKKFQFTYLAEEEVDDNSNNLQGVGRNLQVLDLSRSNACVSFFVLLSKSSSQLKDLDIIIRIVSWLGTFAMLLYFRDTQRKLSKYHRERNSKLSDFAIIIKNLPRIHGIQDTITKFLKDKTLFENLHEIQQIILLPNVDEFYRKEKFKKKLVKQKKKLIGQPQENAEELQIIDQDINDVNEDLFKIAEQIANLQKRDELISEIAIVILSSERDRIDVVEEFRKIDRGCLFQYFQEKAYDLSLKSAPDPREIIWKNANCPKNRKWLWVTLGWTVSVLFLGSVTVVFYFLIYAKYITLENNLQESPDGVTTQDASAIAIVYLTILGVQLFNKFIMKAVLHKICDWQKPQTSSQLQFSYAFKYTLGMFFTTALMTLAVQAIRFRNYTNKYGVVQQESIIFFFNAFFVALLWILHPQYYIRKIFRYYYRGSNDLTQAEANQLMEDYPYDMGKRYAQVLQTLWFTFLYASLLPIGPFITFIGLLIYYWIDKYNLLRRSKINNVIQSKLPLSAVTLLEMVLIWKPLGDLIFDLQLREGALYPSTIVMLSLGVIHILFPWDPVLSFFFFEKFNVKTQLYKKTSHNFIQSYRAVNPVMRHMHLPQFVTRLNKHRNNQGSANGPILQIADIKQGRIRNNIENQYLKSNSSQSNTLKSGNPFSRFNPKRSSRKLNEVDDIKRANGVSEIGYNGYCEVESKSAISHLDIMLDIRSQDCEDQMKKP